MEGRIFDKERLIQTSSDVFWTMQLIRNISIDDEQYILGIITQRSTCKLHGWFHNLGKNNKGTRGMNSLLFEDSGKTQSVFQEVKMWLQHGRNSNSRSSSWERTSANGNGQGQSSQRMEDPY